MNDLNEATEERPIYRKRPMQSAATRLYLIECDEGWRTSIVCTGMYEWAADWMLETLGRQPFAPGRRS